MNVDDAMRAAFRRGDDSEVRRLASAELERSRAEQDPSGEVAASCALARVAVRARDYRLAVEHASAALEVARTESQSVALTQMPCHILAAAARLAGDLEQARSAYEDCIALDYSVGDQHMAAVDTHNLAFVRYHLGDVAAARELFTSALHDPGVSGGTPAFLSRAILALHDGDSEKARSLIAEHDRVHLGKGTTADPDDALELELLHAKLATPRST